MAFSLAGHSPLVTFKYTEKFKTRKTFGFTPHGCSKVRSCLLRKRSDPRISDTITKTRARAARYYNGGLFIVTGIESRSRFKMVGAICKCETTSPVSPLPAALAGMTNNGTSLCSAVVPP